MVPEKKPNLQADTSLLEQNEFSVTSAACEIVSAKHVRGEADEAIAQFSKENQYERVTKTVVQDVSSDQAHAQINHVLHGTVKTLESRSADTNKELMNTKALCDSYNAMIELQPEISALLEEVRLHLPSEEWKCLSHDGFKAQMELLHTELAHYTPDLNSTLQDSIDKEKQAVESAHTTNQQLAKELAAAQASCEQADALCKQQSDGLWNQALQICSLQDEVKQMGAKAVEFINSKQLIFLGRKIPAHEDIEMKHQWNGLHNLSLQKALLHVELFGNTTSASTVAQLCRVPAAAMKASTNGLGAKAKDRVVGCIAAEIKATPGSIAAAGNTAMICITAIRTTMTTGNVPPRTIEEIAAMTGSVNMTAGTTPTTVDISTTTTGIATIMGIGMTATRIIDTTLGIIAMTEAIVRVATATTGIKASIKAIAGIEAAAGMEAPTGMEAPAEIEATRLPAVAVVPLTVASTPKALVREVIKPALGIEHYLDIIKKEAVYPLILDQFEQTGQHRPDISHLQLDFKNSLDLPWMTKTIMLLATDARTKAERDQQKYPRDRSQPSFETLVHNILCQLMDIWKSVEPREKGGEDGIMETHQEVYERAEREYGAISKEKRANSHLTMKLTTRKGSVAVLILLLRELGDANVEVWQRIYHILNWMGKDGMSSEESGNENGCHVMRKDATSMMQLIDSIRTLQPNLFNSNGGKPVARVRILELSKRPLPKLYPKSFYDSAWFNSLSYRERMDL
ncbi:hypothetical protein L208DRAFT_1378042 [Tricholoma matsutake]|nr:hypothetical protein L208DRAFT_1378042 [Tricholoma matsutake 945]